MGRCSLGPTRPCRRGSRTIGPDRGTAAQWRRIVAADARTLRLRRSTAVEETVKDATVPELWLICLGYALILAYALGAEVSLFCPSPPPTEYSRRYALGVFAARTPGGAKHKLKAVALALAGIACVFFGAAAGVGLGCYAGLKFNALSVQVLPFLLLGLGINDLFVVFYRYVDVIRSDELDKSASDYASQVVAGVVATAGHLRRAETRRRVAATPRPRRGHSAEMSRGDAAAATRTFRRDHRRTPQGTQ